MTNHPFSLSLTLLLLLFLFPFPSTSELGKSYFSIICLGESGGLDQSDMTSYIIKGRGPHLDQQNIGMVQLDMGTSLKGLTVAADKGAFKGLYSQTDFASTNYTLAGFVLADMIPVYLVTHPHLDHTAGLVISAPADTPQKAILGTDFTIDHLQNDLFNWGTWPNFAKMGEGVAPLGIYNLVKIVDNGNTVYDIPSAHVDIKAFPLVHGDNPSTNPPSSYPSTAYLVSTTPTGSTTARLLFFGDTGADSVQGVGNMADIWAEVAPYVVDETLQVIMLECSYANSQPSDQLFGHLNPTYFMEEMDNLLTAVKNVAPIGSNPATLMRKLQIIVIHIKPTSIFQHSTQPTWETIMTELQEANSMELNLIYLQQGERLDSGGERGWGGGGVGRGVGVLVASWWVFWVFWDLVFL